MIVGKFPNIPGDCLATGYEGWLTLDSMDFSVSRDSKGESDASGNLDVGLGELQECSFSKSVDISTPVTMQFSLRGKVMENVYVHYYATYASGAKSDSLQAEPAAYLKCRFGKVFISSWSIGGDGDGRPTENFSIWFDRVSIEYIWKSQGKSGTGVPQKLLRGWNQRENEEWNQSCDP